MKQSKVRFKIGDWVQFCSVQKVGNYTPFLAFTRWVGGGGLVPPERLEYENLQDKNVSNRENQRQICDMQIFTPKVYSVCNIVICRYTPKVYSICNIVICRYTPEVYSVCNIVICRYNPEVYSVCYIVIYNIPLKCIVYVIL